MPPTTTTGTSTERGGGRSGPIRQVHRPVAIRSGAVDAAEASPVGRPRRSGRFHERPGSSRRAPRPRTARGTDDRLQPAAHPRRRGTGGQPSRRGRRSSLSTLRERRAPPPSRMSSVRTLGRGRRPRGRALGDARRRGRRLRRRRPHRRGCRDLSRVRTRAATRALSAPRVGGFGTHSGFRISRVRSRVKLWVQARSSWAPTGRGDRRRTQARTACALLSPGALSVE